MAKKQHFLPIFMTRNPRQEIFYKINVVELYFKSMPSRRIKLLLAQDWFYNWLYKCVLMVSITKQAFDGLVFLSVPIVSAVALNCFELVMSRLWVQRN